jgi:adenylyltransferase/sulfurtransferase
MNEVDLLTEAIKGIKEPVIVHCRSGVRSAKAIRTLIEKTGKTNLFNLKGGILEYAGKIDPSIPTY